MIVLFTDFGPAGPYTGQIQAVLQQWAPNVPVIRLVDDAPTGNPKLSAYLLAAFRHGFPGHSVFLAIVDPGVGGQRKPVVLQADGQYFVGPDNGLLNTVAVQSKEAQWWEISWQPEPCSMSFHGRDLFAPVAASLATNCADVMLQPFAQLNVANWQADLAQIIYFDHYGNAMTGIRYRDELSGKQLRVNNFSIRQGETFGSVAAGEVFWYKNSSGLVEIAVNQGSAKEKLALELSSDIEFNISNRSKVV